MTGYYMDSLRGLTTLKLFDRDKEHSRVLGEKADVLNYNINCFMKVNFTSFLVTEAMIYAAILFALVNSAGRIADGSMTIAQALIVQMCIRDSVCPEGWLPDPADRCGGPGGLGCGEPRYDVVPPDHAGYPHTDGTAPTGAGWKFYDLPL